MMNCSVEKLLCLNICYGAAEIFQQRKKTTPMPARIPKSVSTFVTHKEVTWSQIAIRKQQENRSAVPLGHNW